MTSAALAGSLLVSPVAVAAESSKASDFDKHWAKDTIQSFIDQGYVQGYGENSFRPDEYMTRAELVVSLNRVLGLRGEADINFTDVPKDAWYYKDLAIAVYNGYIHGYGDNTFRGDNAVTRAEACVMLTQAGGLEVPEDGEPPVGDVPEWAADYIALLYGADIIQGYEDGSLQANHQVSRAEVLVLMERYQKTEASLPKRADYQPVKSEEPTPEEAKPEKVEEKPVAPWAEAAAGAPVAEAAVLAAAVP